MTITGKVQKFLMREQTIEELGLGGEDGVGRPSGKEHH